MKTYVGYRTGDHICHVDVCTDDSRKPLPLRLDLYNHSPDGFEWG
jgi:hypothetical protein